MMARDKRVPFLAALFVAASWGVAAPQPTPVPTPTALPTPALRQSEDDRQAIELLRTSMNARRVNSYVGQVQMIRWGPAGATASIAKVEHLAPDQTHRIYLAPADVYGDSVVIRGAQMRSYDTHHQRVIESSGPVYNAQILASGNFGLLTANYRPVLSAPETIAGRSAIPCALINRYTGVRVMRIWIDRETKLVLQRETYHPNGTIGARLQFDSIRYTQAIQKQVFATAVPHGFSVVQGRKSGTPSIDLDKTMKAAGFAPAGPRYLPEGFTLVSADVTVVKRVKTFHVLYSDGVRTLSLFENAVGAAADFGTRTPIAIKVEDHDAQYVNDGPTTLLSWKEAGLALALVGDLDIKELRAIAASVIP